jgi:hypothetical protein
MREWDAWNAEHIGPFGQVLTDAERAERDARWAERRAARVSTAEASPVSASPFEGTDTFARIRLSKVRAERVNWYIDGLVPKNLHVVLAAPGGTVKGLFSLFLTANYIEGPVLYLGTEDDPALILKPRAMALGMDVDRFIPLFKRGPDGTNAYSLTFPSDTAILAEAIGHYGAKAVIIDSGIEHMDPGLKSNNTEDVRKVTHALNQIAQTRRVLVIDILHTNKTKDTNGAGRILSSTTWKDAARHVLLAAKDDEDKELRHVEVVKTNIGQEGFGRAYRVNLADVPTYDHELGIEVDTPTPYLTDEGESTKDVDDLLGARGGNDEPDLDDLILCYIAEHNGPVESKTLDEAVADGSGFEKRTVRNRRMRLNKRGLTEAVKEWDGTGKTVKWFTRLSLDGHARVAELSGGHASPES